MNTPALNEGVIVALDSDLFFLEYDLVNSPGCPADEIRRRATGPGFDQLRQELPKCVVQLGSDAKLFRIREHDSVPTEPWPSHGMRGHPDFPWARANLDGQPIIYCADSPETAFAEVRGGPGAWFTIAMLHPQRPLNLVTVARRLGDDEGSLAIIDSWMSRPVNDRSRLFRPYPAANEKEYYYATQFFSCLVRGAGYDGVQFSSSVRKGGMTFALFDPCCIDVIDRWLDQA